MKCVRCGGCRHARILIYGKPALLCLKCKRVTR